MTALPPTWYILTVVGVLAGITFLLRAVPFVILKPLRESRFVLTMAAWMPAGILLILAANTFSDQAADLRTLAWTSTAVLVTAIVHLISGRRTLYSVGLGTLTFIILVNFF